MPQITPPFTGRQLRDAYADQYGAPPPFHIPANMMFYTDLALCALGDPDTLRRLVARLHALDNSKTDMLKAATGRGQKVMMGGKVGGRVPVWASELGLGAHELPKDDS